ncbi:unnamed protein product [Toxocara canis]|uniref:Protein kinase domain-containing protein n=1 Tax=Toxocara canis TaxID=6265 RepID=A0A183UGX6_TOXCA|nr:unnamed protein product [Toxocara canis]
MVRDIAGQLMEKACGAKTLGEVDFGKMRMPFATNAALDSTEKLVPYTGHVKGSSLYAGLGFSDPLRTAITISFVAYCIFFFGFCIFAFVAFVSFILRVERFRMQDEEKAKNSLMLMRTIRADMIELKKQKSVIETLTGSASPMLIWLIALFFTEIHGEEVERFNEERDREEAAVAAQSTRLQSSTETQKEAVVGRERKILRGGQDLKRSILPEYSPKGEPRRELTASRRLIIAKRQDTLSPEAKTSREREKSEKQSKSKVAKTGSTHSRKTEGVQVQKKPLVVQATQSLESTGSTQRSLIMSPKKKTSSVPGVIRKGTSTTKPHKLRTTRRQRRHAGKGKKHKRGKISANASETTDESAQSTMQSNVASPVELPHRECSNVPFSSSAQKTVGTASPKPLSLQKLVGPVIRVDPSAQKVKCTTVSQSPAARKTAKAAQLPVQETVRTVIAKPPSLKIPTSSQMPTQKTCFISPARTVTPAALFQQRTAHPTEPSHLPVRSTVSSV